MISDQLRDLLLANAKSEYPNDKDLISSKLLIEYHAGSYLISDEKGYITFVQTIEDLNAVLAYPGKLRELLGTAEHKFHSRGFSHKKFDLSAVQI